MPELPKDWRQQVVDMIRGAAPLSGELFAGGTGLDPLEQIAVYRAQYTIRLPKALAEDAPGLMRLAGDAWPDIVERYLLAHPPNSWSLDHLGRHLERWLTADGAPTEYVEMACVDEAVQRAFVAAEGRIPRPEDLVSLPPLSLQPYVELVRVSHSVHRYRAEALSDEAPAPLEPGDFHLVIYRRDRRVRHIEMPRAAWWILEGMHLGPEASIERAAAHAEPGELEENLADWFRLFAERRLLQLR
ncbi:MAG: DUF2063 domain-containing protein [Proteobacteria bacterium]|nr:DUF2063 domain-containing protein [Pseudomonadota bacterium]MCP4919760.1 DUF2063 domain-containing protein [Pseudomonadota bacterium]